MKNKTIFTYDKEPDCAYCAFGDNGACTKGIQKRPCALFRYDVFKRKPKQSPALQQFEEKDFQI